MIPEYLCLFSNKGDIDVEVHFMDCDGMVSRQRMHAEEISRLIDDGCGGFFKRMDFDEITFEISTYEIDPAGKRVVIHARSVRCVDDSAENSSIFDLVGHDRAELFARLYNASCPQGLGILEYDPVSMTCEEARALIDTGKTWFDYVKGRVMKVRLDGNQLDARLFDQHYGLGMAAAIIGKQGKSHVRIHKCLCR